MSPTAPVVRSLGEVTLRVYIWEHRIRSPSSFTYQTVRLQLFLPLSCDALGAPSEDVVLSPRHVLPAPLRWWPSLPFLHHIRGRRRWPISDDSPPPHRVLHTHSGGGIYPRLTSCSPTPCPVGDDFPVSTSGI